MRIELYSSVDDAKPWGEYNPGMGTWTYHHGAGRYLAFGITSEDVEALLKDLQALNNLNIEGLNLVAHVLLGVRDKTGVKVPLEGFQVRITKGPATAPFQVKDELVLWSGAGARLIPWGVHLEELLKPRPVRKRR